jgi:hypothetical protein
MQDMNIYRMTKEDQQPYSRWIVHKKPASLPGDKKKELF